MDVLNFNAHNILFNTQPYPLNSIRPRYPVVPGDNTGILYFPWWTTNALWSGDVTQLLNGQTSLPFTNIAAFKAFCNAHFYTAAAPPVLNYLGTWDASTNTPTLTNGDPDQPADFYVAIVPGTVDFGAGPITFAINDLVGYNGSLWQNAGSLANINLQQVTTLGNTTSNGILFTDSSANQLAAISTPGGTSPSIIAVESADSSTGIALITMPDNSVNELIFLNTGGQLNLRADVLTATRTQQYPDADGTIALTADLVTTVNPQTGTTYTPALADLNALVTCSNAAPVTVTIPANGTVAFPVGTRIDFVQMGAGKVSFVPATGVTINSLGGNLSIFAQYVGVTIIQVAADTWLLAGNLSA
jgi:hypothetical protein